MADELNSTSNDVAPSDAGVGTETVDNGQSNDTEDLGALKRAYERTKEELKALKIQAQRAKILDQLEEGGVKPEDLPTKLKELKEQQNAEERISQLKAELESANAAEKREIQQRYEAQISVLNNHVKAQTRRAKLTDVFITGGGSAQNELDANQFSALVSQFIELEDVPIKDENGAVISYESKVKSFKSPKGEQLWVDHEKEIGKVRPAELDDFLRKIKAGEYGRALQILLPAYNQSSGSDISSSGGIGGANYIRTSRSNLAEMMAKMSPQELTEFRQGLNSGKKTIEYVD